MPLFSENIISKNLKIKLFEKNEILTNDAKIARNSKIRFKKTCPTK